MLKFQNTIETLDLDEETKLYASMKPVLEELVNGGEISSIIDVTYDIDFFENTKNTYCTVINKEFLDRYPVEVEGGRSFTDKEIQGEIEGNYVPIIIGNNLKSKYKVGDILSEKLNGNEKIEGDRIIHEVDEFKYKMIRPYYKYKVIAIAEPNTMVYLDEANELESKYMDNMIYICNHNPNVEIYIDGILDNKLSEEYGERNWIGFVESHTKEASSKVKEKLNAELKSRNNMGYMYYPTKDNTMLKELKVGYMSSLILCFIFSIFSIVGVIGSTIYSIKDRRKEYGIISALGAKKRYIILENTLKVIAMLAISLVLALGISAILRNDIVNAQTVEAMHQTSDILITDKYLFVINKELMKVLAGVFALVGIISSIPIVYKVKSYSVVDLIRGK